MLGILPLSSAPLSESNIASLVVASAAINGNAVVTSGSTVYKYGSGSINGLATVTANGGYGVLASASILGRSLVTAAANNDVSASASVTAKAEVVAFGGIQRLSGTISVLGRAVVTTKGMIYGEEWTKVSPVGDTWLRQE
jgi:hypothetical protein